MEKLTDFWKMPLDKVVTNFQNFRESIYPGFKFKYNWHGKNRVTLYLVRLMMSSYYDASFNDALPEYIHGVEDFIASGMELGIFDDATLSDVIKSLSNLNSGCLVLSVLPENKRALYSMTSGNKVLINPCIKVHPNSNDLKDREVTKLYMFKELAKKILHISDNYGTIRSFNDTIDDVLLTKGFGLDTKPRREPDLKNRDFVYNGFVMLEEAMAQELAECLLYHCEKKTRPLETFRGDLGVNVKTNHDSGAIYEKITADFGRTLCGCSDEYLEDGEVIINMVKKALSSDFVSEVIAEYNADDADKYYTLFKVLRLMGMVERKKSSSMGIADDINVNIPSVMDALEELLSLYRENRSYPKEGFTQVDFMQYKVPSFKGSR